MHTPTSAFSAPAPVWRRLFMHSKQVACWLSYLDLSEPDQWKQRTSLSLYDQGCVVFARFSCVPRSLFICVFICHDNLLWEDTLAAMTSRGVLIWYTFYTLCYTDFSCVLMCTCSFRAHSQVENKEAHQYQTKPTAPEEQRSSRCQAQTRHTG